MNSRIGKILRTAGIIFFGLATLMNLLGGIGTTCAAFFTSDYPPFAALIEEGMQWLYQRLVIATVLLGIIGIWIIVQLTRGAKIAYRNALIVLACGTILAGIQYYSSMQLFGKAAPANIKFYSNVLALILFLIFLIPGIWEVINYSRGESGAGRDTAGGLAAFVLGVILLTTPIWSAPSHTYQGENWVNLLRAPIVVSGLVLTGGGIALVMRATAGALRRELRIPALRLHKE
jgi:hypothetical protein